MSSGPLCGIRVLEFGALGPVPFCAMMLADMGAEVIHLARPGAPRYARHDVTLRGRRILPIDLKCTENRAQVMDLVKGTNILLEGHRPGVMERLGLGPDVCLDANPRLIYGRMTGWGQKGPLAPTAGHDINYIALTGALDAIGSHGGPPVPPLNLVGDYGGGAMFLGFGVLCAFIEAQRSGHGQVVDAAMVDGAALLMSLFHGFMARGQWIAQRGGNHLDGGAPWYGTYETADGRYIAVGALEEPFWQELLAKLQIDAATLPRREDRSGWPIIRAKLEQAFRQRERDVWAEVFAQSDACVSPILNLDEVANHPHMAQRSSMIEVDGIMQPAPAPRFSRTPGKARPPIREDLTAANLLSEWSVRRRERSGV
ncbi:CaiB/BaiF CoA-transferase family protein [Roseomonas gilardii]|uniref:CaiB/BaiF CoA-transferase family protein n=1 Tax=Roseomonas gilardii TaxID=257708 RepID=A0ABU3MLV1_9PROT|nr:CaiB/BaiF CoA-transferase family protein [Roseomonas gilardii]MDT8333862.1 CaiB/BaiF CoA-transferase family protein [Roseomonas gilardii]